MYPFNIREKLPFPEPFPDGFGGILVEAVGIEPTS